jgi:hypothetical protein
MLRPVVLATRRQRSEGSKFEARQIVFKTLSQKIPITKKRGGRVAQDKGPEFQKKKEGLKLPAVCFPFPPGIWGAPFGLPSCSHIPSPSPRVAGLSQTFPREEWAWGGTCRRHPNPGTLHS